MKYKNAQDILPDRLLAELQKYVAGGMLYVPNQHEKKQWGEASGARRYYTERNGRIRARHAAGATISEPAEEFHLSVDFIRKILA